MAAEIPNFKNILGDIQTEKDLKDKLTSKMALFFGGGEEGKDLAVSTMISIAKCDPSTITMVDIEFREHFDLPDLNRVDGLLGAAADCGLVIKMEDGSHYRIEKETSDKLRKIFGILK